MTGSTTGAERPARRLRSLLFVPGDREDRMIKAAGCGADGLVLDLEDSVPGAAKDAARAATVAAIDAIAATAAVALFVRVNGWRTGRLIGDVLAVVRPGVTGILLPQPGGAGDVEALDALVGEVELDCRLTPGSVEIFPTIESATGLLHAGAIAAASTRVRRFRGADELVHGGDLARSLGMRGRPDQLASAFSGGLLNAAARANGITQVYGGMTTDLSNLDGLRASCERARDLGATGSFAIHPRQLPVIHEVFSIRPDEIDRARAILAALEEAVARGGAATRLGDEMIDLAHARDSTQLLRDAAAMGIDVGEILDLEAVVEP